MSYKSRYKIDVNLNQLELPRYLNIEKTPDDIYFRVDSQHANRLDLISYTYYNISNLGWVLALVNNIMNPLVIPEGTILKIPPITTIFKYLEE